MCWVARLKHFILMTSMPDDRADAQFLYEMVISMRRRHSVATYRDHVLLRRALELVWEKPRERGDTYGQYRHSFYWSRAALELANDNVKKNLGKNGRGLIKEHVVPYGELVKGLLAMQAAGTLTPETLTTTARSSLHPAVITVGEDQHLREKLRNFVSPDPWDLSDADQVWVRYTTGGLDLSNFRSIRYSKDLIGRRRLREAIEEARIPGLTIATAP